jgi:hypothetical protein
MKTYNATIKAIPRSIGPKNGRTLPSSCLAFDCLQGLSSGDQRKLSPLIAHKVQLSVSIGIERR